MNAGGWGALAFAHPHALLLLALPVALAALRAGAGGAPAIRYPASDLLAAAGARARRAAGPWRVLPAHLAIACLAIALAGPRREMPRHAARASGVEILIALDVSRSMLAEDFTIDGGRAHRLDAIKGVTAKFIRGRPDDRIGIVAFAGRPYLVSPLTLDHEWLAESLERVRVGLVEDGTAIGGAIAAAANRLRDSRSKTKLVILLTDGDNNAGHIEPETAAEAAAALGIKIYTIGAGTRGTAPFPMIDPLGRTVYRQTRVEFDEARLRRIAETTSARYYRATDTRSLDGIFAEIDRFEKTEMDLGRPRDTRDLSRYPLALGIALLAAQLALASTLWRTTP